MIISFFTIIDLKFTKIYPKYYILNMNSIDTTKTYLIVHKATQLALGA